MANITKVGITVGALGFIASLAGGCSSSTEVGQTEDELAGCTSSDAWWKTQYDDPSPGSCEGPVNYTNCGPATMAMMRYALTCGQSNKTAAQMRTLVIDYTAVNDCSGTTPAEWETVLDKTHNGGLWIGDNKLPAFPSTNHCVSTGANANYSAADLAADMKSGRVTVAGVAGRYTGSGGQKGPCGWDNSGGHALFVSAWNGSTFTVYDPDSHKNSAGKFVRCGSSKPGNYKAQWTPAELTKWSGGFSNANNGQLCALTATRPCVPGTMSLAGCATNFDKICTADFTWGACLPRNAL